MLKKRRRIIFVLKKTMIERRVRWCATLLFVVSVSGTICIPAASAATQATYYVSPAGSDSNAGTESAPFLTITKARDIVRTINGNMTGDIYVYLRGGNYSITSTITFAPQDSGTNGYRIFYQAYTGEEPVLNGGTLVTGWTQHSGNIWKATLNHAAKLRTLIVNDKRAYMAGKNANCQGSWGTYNISAGQADWAWISGSKADGALYATGDVAALANAGDVEIINSTTWNQNIVCVREITTEGGSRVLKFQQPMGAIALNQGWSAGFATSGSHKIQNAYELLDSAGEFYFNRAMTTLYYYRGSEDMSTAVVYAPRIRTLIEVSGTSKTSRVRNITFKGMTFANTEAELPQVGGSSGKTTCQSTTWCKAFANTNWHTDKYRAYDVILGGIVVTSADSINFTDNSIKHIGNEGISLVNDVSNCTILGNSITDIGGSGIQVGHPQHIYEGDGGTNEKYSSSVEGICRNDTIKNNYIYGTTNLYLAHQGISAYFVDTLAIEHNQIEGTNYGGVSLGWGWCEFDEVAFPSNPTKTCKNNKFNNNRVFDCMKTLNDSGAFYTIGAQPDSQASNNYVKASTTHFQGVYHPDEGTAWYTGNNLVFDIVPGQDNFELNDWKRKHDNHYDNIYTTSSAYQIGAPNCTVTNLHVYSSSASFPQAALDIINNAGLEPAYQYLLPGNATPTPTGPTAEPTAAPTIGPTPVPGTVSIACGSSSAVGDFQPDQYYSGGSTYTNTNTVDVSQIGSNPPPAALFNNERYGAMSYTIPGFTPGSSYEVTLYFAETYLTSSGGRLFDVSINNATVLANFDIYAAAGGQNKAIARSFTTNADSSGQIVVQFVSGTENPKINGIAVNPNTNNGTLGDVNGSGTVDIVDALLIAQYYVGLNPPGFVAANADVNCSGSIDIVDALLVAQYYVGLVTGFC